MSLLMVLLHHRILFIKTKCNFYYPLHRNFSLFSIFHSILFMARLFHIFSHFSVGFFFRGDFNQFQFYSILQKRNSLSNEQKISKFILRISKVNQNWKDFPANLNLLNVFFFRSLTERSEMVYYYQVKFLFKACIVNEGMEQ